MRSRCDVPTHSTLKTWPGLTVAKGGMSGLEVRFANWVRYIALRDSLPAVVQTLQCRQTTKRAPET
jgi:hypothetical protein